MTVPVEPPGRVLRDYLYVDVDKVKSIAGQLESGVPEASRLTTKDATRTTLGWKAVLSYSPESSQEGYVDRSMLDSLFPELEDILEQGWLEDVSEEFEKVPSAKLFEFLKKDRPEGSIFRLTADGFLFDVRYYADLFSKVSATLSGFQDFEKAKVDLAESMAMQASGAPPKKAPPPKKQRETQAATAEHLRLEDAVEEFAPRDSMSPGLFRSMIHAARGVFSPGLHLVMANGTGAGAFSVNARLQDNGRYLDATPAIIASRFGMKPQRWTIVATVGHYSEEPEVAGMASIAAQVENNMAADFNRARFVRTMNASVRDMAKSGLVDLPQHPGMSAIPIAVYRAVRGGPDLTALEPARSP